MKIRIALLALVVICVCVAVPLFAHQETHKGVVIVVEKTSVRVDVVDPKTKKVAPRVFHVDAETKVLRGDAVVTFAAADIKKAENIAVTVDHDLDEELALVIRLDAVK